jgi:alpha-tubulin suppressor-like RCC1 family protein
MILSLGCGNEGSTTKGEPASQTDKDQPSLTVTVAIAPASASVTAGAKTSFTATVAGSKETRVTWRVREAGGGTVSSTGEYTAPNAPGTFHVEAKSVADPAKSAAATVSVSLAPDTSPPETVITQHPPALTTATMAVFTFSGTDDGEIARYECALNGAAWQTCSSPKSYANLATDTTHTFAVRAIDAADNADPSAAEFVWRINGGTKPATLAAGDSFSCHVSAGAAKCWGYNHYGQLGDGSTTDANAPVAVSGLGSGVRSIAAGSYFTCALLSAGGIRCWGRNGSGQVGNGTQYNDQPTPVDVGGAPTGIVKLALGDGHACAFTSGGALYCWGYNGNAELGDGTTTTRLSATLASTVTEPVIDVALGSIFTCAVTRTGVAKCWGSDNWGTLGNGSGGNSITPAAVAGLPADVVAVAAGTDHACALTSAGGVYCWGSGAAVGRGGSGMYQTAGQVVGLSSGAIAIDAASFHTCALMASGGVKCWGENTNGVLGDGTTTNRTSPVDVLNLTGVIELATGGGHTCAAMGNGNITCWGGNVQGQLGDGTNTSQLTPTTTVVP